MKDFPKDKTLTLLVTWLIILDCFSYPITAVVIAYFQVPSNPINIGLKALYSLLALWIIFRSLLRQGLVFPKRIVWGLIFFAIYSLRLILDISLFNVWVLLYSTSYVLAYFFGATLLPIIAVTLAYKNIEVGKITNWTFWTLVLSNLMLIYYLLVLGDFGNLEHQLAVRAHIKTEGSEIGSLINPITIGYNGGSLIIFCFNAYLVRFFSSRVVNFLLLPFSLLGLLVLFLGASRGPLVGTILLMIISLIVHFYKSKEKLLKLGKAIFILTTIYVLLGSFVTQITKKYDLFLLYRMERFVSEREKGEKEARDYSYEGAWNDFLSSPVIGKQFVGTYDNFYPHNIFLEVLMATGIIGGLFFGLYFIQFFKSTMKLMMERKYKFYIPFLFTTLLGFFLSLTSGSIYSSPEIWIFMTIITLII